MPLKMKKYTLNGPTEGFLLLTQLGGLETFCSKTESHLSVGHGAPCCFETRLPGAGAERDVYDTTQLKIKEPLSNTRV